MTLIDFHAQIHSDQIAKLLPEPAKRWGKFWAKPVSHALHEAQPWLRFLPPLGRAVVRELGAAAPLSHLLLESSLADLRESMDRNQIDRCVVLSDPLQIENEKLLRLAKEDTRWIPAIRVPLNTDVKEMLSKASGQGAQILQLHPASDGLTLDCDFYTAQLNAAAESGWIVLLKCGSPKSRLLFRDSKGIPVERFKPWFNRWPSLRFVIARMGFDDPEGAMDLAEHHGQLFLETSWQPTETIAEAVRRMGADRIVYGSDWPTLGNNQRVGILRIRDAVDSEMFSQEDGEKILGRNAERLLGGKN